jgi:hypothetical protein
MNSDEYISSGQLRSSRIAQTGSSGDRLRMIIKNARKKAPLHSRFDSIRFASRSRPLRGPSRIQHRCILNNNNNVIIVIVITSLYGETSDEAEETRRTGPFHRLPSSRRAPIARSEQPKY